MNGGVGMGIWEQATGNWELSGGEEGDASDVSAHTITAKGYDDAI